MAAPTFAKRASAHDEFMATVERDLRTWGYEVYNNGRENIAPGYQIGRLNDPGARDFRFRPDLAVLFNNRIIYIDPKLSKFIERDPYEVYTDMSRRGIPVYIACQSNNEIRFSYSLDILFKTASSPVWPVSDDGWITPRMHPRYQEYKYNYPLTGRPFPGSGTPFREIDFYSMQQWGPMFLAFDINSR